MKTSDAIDQIAKAMSLAQSEMKPASKDATNAHFRSRYSDLSSVWEAIRRPLTANGLTVWQDVTTTDSAVSVVTRLVHQSGQWVEFGPLSIPMGKKDAHGVGSCTTYAKRFSLCAAVGVVSGDEDDDGNGSIPKEHVNSSPPPMLNIAKTAADLYASVSMVNELKMLIKDDPDSNKMESYILNECKCTWETIPISFYNGLLERAKKRAKERNAES